MAIGLTRVERPACPSPVTTGPADAPDGPCRACAVRRDAVCATLAPQDLNRLFAMVSRVSLEVDRVLFYEGDPAGDVYNVTDGIVRLSKLLADGRRQVTGFLPPGSIFGFGSTAVHCYTADALTPLKLCRFSRVQLDDFLQDFPDFGRRVLAKASGELRAAQDQILLLGRKSAQEKVATFLRDWLREASALDVAGRALELPMTRTDIADYLGLSTATVSRVFTGLVRLGVLELPSAHEVVVRRPDLLDDLTEATN